ncbi:signal peptidase I [Virgibacillus soli]|uniref:Signal peptidase I n=1 Tax=Paracerasibacillus soli TaxID=480284 RepID=A0ABU5CWE3_9BACI|nr:signal peptidase I [Virgibacillus soli]MDY0410157.1 signal peptidase I [Virgibacillus soli]
MKSRLKVVNTIFFTSLFIICCIILMFFFYAKGDVDRFPSIVGYKPLTILSNSMKPAFQVGDIVIIHKDKEPQVNEVVTFKHPEGILVTHRVVDSEIVNGMEVYSTKGDNNHIADDLLISKEQIVGVVQFVIPKVGYVANFMSGPVGFSLFVLAPLLILANIQIFKWLGLTKNEKEGTGT